MRRYLVFLYNERPLGGWNDFQVSASTIDVGIAFAIERRSLYENVQIVDTVTGAVVCDTMVDDIITTADESD